MKRNGFSGNTSTRLVAKLLSPAIQRTEPRIDRFRRVPIIPPLKELIERIKKQRGAGIPDDRFMIVATAKDAMDSAAERIGMERLTHHDLRHLFATTCIESGVDIPTVSRWLGHKDGGVLAIKVYGHLRNQHSLEAAKNVSFS